MSTSSSSSPSPTSPSSSPSSSRSPSPSPSVSVVIPSSAVSDQPIVEEGTLSDALLEATLRAIESGDLPTLNKYLGLMPLEQLSSEDSSSLLQRLLSVATINNQQTVVDPILEAFHVTYPEELQNIDFFSTLFLDMRISLDVLQFIARSKPTITFADVIDELINMDPRESLTTACQRVSLTFGPQRRGVYQALAQDAESRENFVVVDFMKAQLLPTNEYANIPDWMKNFVNFTGPIPDLPEEEEEEGEGGGEEGKEGEEEGEGGEEGGEEELPASLVPLTRPVDISQLPQITQNSLLPNLQDAPIPEYLYYPLPLPSTREEFKLVAAQLLNGLKEVGYLFQEEAEEQRAQQTLEARLSIATQSELIALMEPILHVQQLEEPQFNLYLFRLLGPANPFYNADEEQMRFGGTRMFLGRDFDYHPSSGTVRDWFIGYCEYCQLRIRRRWHAIRIPGMMGGWKGCYCSFKCIRDYLDELDAIQTPDMVTRVLVDAVEVQIRRIGIQDRV